MKLLMFIHKWKLYEMRLLESTSEIQITKHGVYSYSIHNVKGRWYCDCWGFRRHHKCHHMTHIDELLQQPTVNEPWAQWAEEAAQEQEDRV
uniref:SWIM-type domain-containing protein n=1 Tax=viral metagenome TaxID=1070528 RepID=A0A6M3K8K1_9ZZZZ